MNKRVIAALLAVLMVTGLFGCETDSASAQQSSSEEPAYQNTIFDTSYVHKIKVDIGDADWADLLENPTDKTKYSVDVTIDGVTVENVSLSTKGNTSLSHVANSDSDRYSFKINFGKYVNQQTFDGLDKLNLNNIFSDATYMKDYLSYRIMEEAGANAPLTSFTMLSINGEAFGLYLCIEDVDDAFLARNYGDDAGQLYKPATAQIDNMGGGMQMPADGEMPTRGDGGFTPPTDGEMPTQGEEGFTPPTDGEMPTRGEGDLTQSIDDTEEVRQRGGPGGGMGGGFGGSANGASLVYTDDAISSYSDIFDNAETDAVEEDYQRVIAALKQLSTGEDMESAIDVEAVLKYFVAHNFVINYDSYTGNMLHNYYLYEKDGKLSMLPWDYNLAFGGFQESDATEAVNWPIDSPLAKNVSEEDRPMWSKLASNEEYLSDYHTYFDTLISDYFESGRFEAELDSLYTMLRPYVESSTNTEYDVDAFDTAVESLRSFCLLRAQSIRGQLVGTIPATAQGQAEDGSALVDASSVTLSDMGGMDFGRGVGFDPENMERGQRPGAMRPEDQTKGALTTGDTKQSTQDTAE